MPYGNEKDDYIDFVARAAVDENWGDDNRYLRTYIADNFEIAYQQGLVKENGEGSYALWRVGNLTTREGEPVSIVCERNRQPGRQPYYFLRVFDRARFNIRLRQGEDVSDQAPAAPTYDLPAYHPEYSLTYNFDHYLDDHADRAKETFPQLNDHQRFLCIYAALVLAHKRYKQAAVPQWYRDKNEQEGGYQWLLPLHINTENISKRPDLVAALDPVDEHEEYYVRTLLPPEYCYGHARSVSERDPHFRSWA